MPLCLRVRNVVGWIVRLGEGRGLGLYFVYSSFVSVSVRVVEGIVGLLGLPWLLAHAMQLNITMASWGVFKYPLNAQLLMGPILAYIHLHLNINKLSALEGNTTNNRAKNTKIYTNFPIIRKQFRVQEVILMAWEYLKLGLSLPLGTCSEVLHMINHLLWLLLSLFLASAYPNSKAVTVLGGMATGTKSFVTPLIGVNEVTATFDIQFQNTPKAILTFVELSDTSSESKVEMTLKIQSVTTSQLLLQYTVSTSTSNYPEAVRGRYLAFDSVLYPSLEIGNVDAIQNLIVTTKVERVSVSGDLDGATILCFLMGMVNSKVSNFDDYKVHITCSNDNGQLKVTVQTFSTIQSSVFSDTVIKASYLISYLNDTIITNSGTLQSSNSQSAFISVPAILTNTFFLIGLRQLDIVKGAHILTVGLQTGDTAINTAYDYKFTMFRFCYIQPQGLLGMYLNKVKLGTLSSDVIFQFLDSPHYSLMIPGDFFFTPSSFQNNGLSGLVGGGVVVNTSYLSSVVFSGGIEIEANFTYGMVMYSIQTNLLLVFVSEIISVTFSKLITFRLNNLPSPSSVVLSNFATNVSGLVSTACSTEGFVVVLVQQMTANLLSGASNLLRYESSNSEIKAEVEWTYMCLKLSSTSVFSSFSVLGISSPVSITKFSINNTAFTINSAAMISGGAVQISGLYSGDVPSSFLEIRYMWNTQGFCRYTIHTKLFAIMAVSIDIATLTMELSFFNSPSGLALSPSDFSFNDSNLVPNLFTAGSVGKLNVSYDPSSLNTTITLTYHTSGNLLAVKMQFYLVHLNSINNFVFLKELTLSILTPPSVTFSSLSHFQLTSTQYHPVGTTFASDVILLQVQSSSTTTASFDLNYSPFVTTFSSMFKGLLPVSLSEVTMDVTTISTVLTLDNILVEVGANPSYFQVGRSEAQVVNLSSSGSSYLLTLEYIYTNTSSLPLRIDYLGNPTLVNSQSRVMSVSMDLNKDFVLLANTTSTIAETVVSLCFLNVRNPANVGESDFILHPSQGKFKHVLAQEHLLILQVELDPTVTDESFEVIFTDPSTRIKYSFESIPIVFLRELKPDLINNQLQFVFQKIPSQGSLTHLPFTFNTPNIIATNTTVHGSDFILVASYNSSVLETPINITLRPNNPLLHYNVISLVPSAEILYCPAASLTTLTGSYNKFSQFLQYLFLALFAFSLIHMKMVGLETIFLIQVTFFSMISIEARCPPFIAFKSMQYVGGFNPFFLNHSSVRIPPAYSVLGIQAAFISNVNLMLMPLILCPFLSLILNLAGQKSTSYKMKPRLFKYSKAFLCEIPLTILLFNSSRVQISFVVNIQWLGTMDLASFLVSLAVEAVYVLAFILLPIFRSSFSEFQQEIDESSQIGSIAIKKSTTIRKFYPMCMMTEMVLVPILLSLEALNPYNIYICLGITSIITVYAFVATPYIHMRDNIRLLVNRLLLGGIVIILAYIKAAKAPHSGPTEFVYKAPWTILVLLTCSILMNGVFIMWNSILWLKKPGIINMSMYIKQKGLTTKPEVEAVPQCVLLHNSYPKMEFGRFPRALVLQLRQNQLDQDVVKRRVEQIHLMHPHIPLANVEELLRYAEITQ